MGKRKPKKSSSVGSPSGSTSSSLKNQASTSPATSPLKTAPAISVNLDLGSDKTPAKTSVADLVSSENPIQPTVATTDSVPDLAAKALDLQQQSKVTKPLAQIEPEVPDQTWCDLVKGTSRKLKKKGTPFILESGEVCVKIPNSVITKNAKSWDNFIIGQFYADPPSKGAVHAIVNGIWSKTLRDITVSKLDGFAYLFRVPNHTTRKHILAQGLWQIEGQTMFVAKWAPGPKPIKPELTSAPVWLEFKNVPHQFWSEEGWEHIAGMVGHPILVHPSTLNMTNLEVGKVLTVIDPRKPLPEGVNAQFDSGDICRIEVSSPWMPPICSHCSGIGHSIKRCPTAPITCTTCKSSAHPSESCPRAKSAAIKSIAGSSKQVKPLSKPPPLKEMTPKQPDPKSVVIPPTVNKDKGKAIDIDFGSLTVDFSAGTSLPPVEKSHSGADDDPGAALTSPLLSEEDDNPDEDNSQFQQVFSKRYLRSARGRGPSR